MKIGIGVDQTGKPGQPSSGWNLAYAWATTLAPSIQTTQRQDLSVSPVITSTQASALAPTVSTSSSVSTSVSPIVASSSASSGVPTVSTTKSPNIIAVIANAQATAGVPSVSTGSTVNTSVSSVVAGATASAGVPTVSIGGGSTVLVSDSFNRANNATTLGTTDSYNGGTPKTWQYRSGSVFGISNNTAITESGTNPVIAYVDSGQSDVKVNVTAVLSNVNDYFMSLFRYDPATNTGLILGGNPIKIQSFSGSTYTNIATTSINNAANDVFQIVLSGSSITVYQNGTQVVSGTSTINQTKTSHGLIDWRSINNGWDNFFVTTP